MIEHDSQETEDRDGLCASVTVHGDVVQTSKENHGGTHGDRTPQHELSATNAFNDGKGNEPDCVRAILFFPRHSANVEVRLTKSGSKQYR